MASMRRPSESNEDLFSVCNYAARLSGTVHYCASTFLKTLNLSVHSLSICDWWPRSSVIGPSSTLNRETAILSVRCDGRCLQQLTLPHRYKSGVFNILTILG